MAPRARTMPTIFDSLTKLIGPYLDELSGGVLKSRCEHRTIGAALDLLNNLVVCLVRLSAGPCSCFGPGIVVQGGRVWVRRLERVGGDGWRRTGRAVGDGGGVWVRG